MCNLIVEKDNNINAIMEIVALQKEEQAKIDYYKRRIAEMDKEAHDFIMIKMNPALTKAA